MERFSIKGPMLDFVARNIYGEKTQILFGEKTVTISCGDASYVIALVAQPYAEMVETIFTKRCEAVKVTVNKAKFATAVNLAVLTTPNKIPLRLSIGEDHVLVKDFFNKAQVRVDATVEGSIDGDIALNHVEFLAVSKNLVAEEEEITFTTDEGGKPIYFFDAIPGSVTFELGVDLAKAEEVYAERNDSKDK